MRGSDMIGGGETRMRDVGMGQQAQQRQMAMALLEIGQTFKAVVEDHLAKNPSESGSPIKIE